MPHLKLLIPLFAIVIQLLLSTYSIAMPSNNQWIAGAVVPPVESTKQQKKKIRKAKHADKKRYRQAQRASRKESKVKQFFAKQNSMNDKAKNKLKLGIVLLSIAVFLLLLFEGIYWGAFLAGTLFAVLTTLSAFLFVLVFVAAIVGFLAVIYLLLGMTAVEKETNPSQKGSWIWIVGIASILLLISWFLIPIMLPLMLYSIGWLVVIFLLLILALVGVYSTSIFLLKKITSNT